MGSELRLGVIGIGAMGMAVARRGLDAGFEVAVRDIRPEADAEAAAAGAYVCGSPSEVARRADVIVVLVVDDRQVEDVVFGPNGLVSAQAPDNVVVASSTVAPAYAASVGERLEAAGRHYLDAPVSGGPAKAREGSMSMMAAGSDAAFERAKPVLERLAGRLFRVGARPGDGSRTKILNNLLAGVNLAAAAEAIALGERLGLDGARLLEVMRASSGDSWVLGDRMPRALAGDFEPRAATRILAKDLGIVTAAAREAGYATPLGDTASALFEAACRLGWSEQDDASLLEFYRRRGGALP